MKINSAEFVRSVAQLDQIPKGRYPEIAFAGRSNVGKSSLINCLLGRKKLAQTSSTPGKTRMLNYYNINNMLYFVDLPGYGYAKVPEKMREGWGQLIESYLRESENLAGVIVVTDARHPLSELDLQMVSFLKELQYPTLLIATKADKLSAKKLSAQLRKNIQTVQKYGVEDILPFSATAKRGKRELWMAIDYLLQEVTP